MYKILIANRGEIALRIIRTCKEMGIKTVALCPRKGEEKNFLETELADEFYYLQRQGILGYLDSKRIIHLAKSAKADAIHPGYGFLAENPDFAALCEKNNLKFIGPKAETLRQLGNKIQAKKIAQKVGIPLLEGTKRSVKDEKECWKMAKKVGFPLMLKASNGGGGIGIEIIEKKDKKKVFLGCQRIKRIGQNILGSGEIFIEKFLQPSHHIEFQILGDGEGKVIHLGERECSVQRRHQKLIEESPSPFLDNKLRKKMGKLAVKLGKRLKYENAGTVEFLVSKDRKFYFLEVNPRLQVEHPITELVTNIDLVEQQILIAQGEKLNLKQKHIKPSGWAMEFRINAENAKNDFQPTTGRINNYFPPQGKGIEIHSFCRTGQEILPYFDNLLAKLVVFAKDRDSVIKRAKRALDEFTLEGEGISTLIPFYKLILKNPVFAQGKISTSFIKENMPLFKKELAKSRLPAPSLPLTLDSFSQKKEKEKIALLVAKLFQEFRKEQEKQKTKSPALNQWLLSAINTNPPSDYWQLVD